MFAALMSSRVSSLCRAAALQPARLLHASAPAFALKVLSKTKEKERVRVSKDEVCIAHVKATYNNTIIAVTRDNGDALNISSAGRVGFKKSKRKSPFAAQEAGQNAAKVAADKWGVRQVHVRIKGIGPGRNNAVKGLMTGGLRIVSVTDVTGIPHNGCRPPKQRRV